MPTSAPSKGRVLYIEDEAFFGGEISKKLTEAGYEAALAKDGDEGLSRLRREKFDLVLLDILLPRVDGYDVLRQMKEDRAMSALPVIVFSNLGSQEDRVKAEGLGAALFLVKALTNPSDVVHSIADILEGHPASPSHEA